MAPDIIPISNPFFMVFVGIGDERRFVNTDFKGGGMESVLV